MDLRARTQTCSPRASPLAVRNWPPTSGVRAKLSTQPRWLMIYVSPACGSCERLMAAIAEWQPAIVASRIVVVIQAAPDAARTYAQTLHLDQVAGLTWYADPTQSGSQALGLQ